MATVSLSGYSDDLVEYETEGIVLGEGLSEPSDELAGFHQVFIFHLDYGEERVSVVVQYGPLESWTVGFTRSEDYPMLTVTDVTVGVADAAYSPLVSFHVPDGTLMSLAMLSRTA